MCVKLTDYTLIFFILWSAEDQIFLDLLPLIAALSEAFIANIFSKYGDSDTVEFHRLPKYYQFAADMKQHHNVNA